MVNCAFTFRLVAPAHAAPLDQSMSTLAKGLRRSTSRTPARRPAVKSAKARSLKTKSAKPRPSVASAKAPAHKAAKPRVSVKSRPTKKAAAAPRKPVLAKKPAKKSASAKTVPKRVTQKTVEPRVKKTHKLAAIRAARPVPVPAPPRQPTVDEAAALRTFERAHKEFTRGRFAEARNQFRFLLEKYAQVSEVAARARTYLAIAESRLRTESMLPRDADSLYDRGVIELNRGEYVAAQEMFERALKREPEAAHIQYGLAATRARLGSIDLALQSLQRALDLQPNLRVRAQHDHDLNPLRNDPDFDKLVFQARA
jgi:tetratricopeptide (TPR) repeat protein